MFIEFIIEYPSDINKSIKKEINNYYRMSGEIGASSIFLWSASTILLDNYFISFHVIWYYVSLFVRCVYIGTASLRMAGRVVSEFHSGNGIVTIRFNGFAIQESHVFSPRGRILGTAGIF